MRAARRAGVRAGLAGVLAAGAVLLALGGPARGGESAGERRVATGARAPARPRRAATSPPAARCSCGWAAAAATGSRRAPASAQVGPDLDIVLPNYDAKMLRAKIADPYPAGTSGSFLEMPAFGSRMSAAELDQLVVFLLSTTRD